MVRDLDDNVNQSLFFSIFLKRISILLILLSLIKNSLLPIEEKLISLSPKLKIFNLKENDINFSSISKNEFLLKGSNINKIDILFQKIERNND